MGFITGPKELIANAITNALDEYFVVDRDKIESNLLGADKKIVLKDVAVRPKTVTILAKNAGGHSSILSVDGTVAHVEFSWEWALTGQTYIQHAKLTIKGLRATAELTAGDVDEDPHTLDKPDILPDEAQIQDEATQTEVKKQGGIQAYVMRQVQLMIDALTLQVADFELTLKTANNEGGTTSVVLGGESIVILSFGREKDDAIAKEHAADLRQTLSITGLYVDILDWNKDNETKSATIIPFIVPFSYNAQMIRAGQRFSSLMKGLTVAGESCDTSGFVLHVGHGQLYAWSQLSMMLLAAKEEGGGGGASNATPEAPPAADEPEDTPPPEENPASEKPSEFSFGAHSMELVLNEEMRLSLSKVAATYNASGTTSPLKAEKFTFTGPGGQAAHVEGLTLTGTPHLTLEMDKLVSLEVPNAVKLVKPSEHIRVELEGSTLKMNLEALECQVLTADPNTAEKEEETKPKDRINVQAPFPMQVVVGQLGIQSGDDTEDRSQFDVIELFVNPAGAEGTDFAVVVKVLDNKLVHLTDLLVCGRRPVKGSNVIQNLKVSADTVEVDGGHSIGEWIETFQLRGDKEKTKKMLENKQQQHKEDKDASEVQLLLPHSRVEPLKVHITYQQGAVGVKDVNFKASEFVGKKNTAAKDLVNFYVAICLKNASGFITNAEVLGLNVVDFGGTLLFGPGGVAAMAALDSVKGAVAAGKKSRKADEEDNANVSDFFRGIGYAAVDATQRGALKRGKKESDNLNVLDWVQGVSDDTGKYVGENKARLGGAGGASAGMVYGTLLGGPVGGIVGGLIGGAITQKAIKAVEKKEAKLKP